MKLEFKKIMFLVTCAQLFVSCADKPLDSSESEKLAEKAFAERHAVVEAPFVKTSISGDVTVGSDWTRASGLYESHKKFSGEQIEFWWISATPEIDSFVDKVLLEAKVRSINGSRKVTFYKLYLGNKSGASILDNGHLEKETRETLEAAAKKIVLSASNEKLFLSSATEQLLVNHLQKTGSAAIGETSFTNQTPTLEIPVSNEGEASPLKGIASRVLAGVFFGTLLFVWFATKNSRSFALSQTEAPDGQDWIVIQTFSGVRSIDRLLKFLILVLAKGRLLTRGKRPKVSWVWHSPIEKDVSVLEQIDKSSSVDFLESLSTLLEQTHPKNALLQSLMVRVNQSHR